MGIDKKVLCSCNIDQHQWMARPHNLLQGSGCPECVHRAKSHDKFVHELQEKNENIVVIGKYINNKTKIKCKCNICGFIWDTLPNNLLKKTRPTGCPNCWKNRNGKSHNDFVKEMSLINPNIKIIGDYINSTTKISCECKICGNIWDVAPHSLISGKGCPICCIQKIKDMKTKTHQTFLDEIQNINPNVKILSKYSGNKNKVKCQCKLDNHIWYATPDNLLHGYGCPCCGKKSTSEKRMKPEYKFIEEMNIKHPDIDVLGKYCGRTHKILFHCKICDNKWYSAPSCLLTKYSGCPKCSCSKGEKIISDYLNKNNIYNIQYKTFDGLIGVGNGNLSYDFYLPDYNLLIEYQGMQHKKPVDFSGKGNDFAIKCFKKQQEHDKRKRKYAQDHNIELLEIWYYDFDNINEILFNYFFRKSA